MAFDPDAYIQTLTDSRNASGYGGVTSWTPESVTRTISMTPEQYYMTGGDKVSTGSTANTPVTSPTTTTTPTSVTQPYAPYDSAVAAASQFTPVTDAQKAAAGVTIKDASAYQSPETSVAAQLTKLLGSDSEYMKQSAAKSKLTANEVGMLSSDRYIGAAQGAAIREGLPIATADAGTAAKFGLQQQQGDNTLANTSLDILGSSVLKQQQAQIDAQAAKTKAAIDTALAAAAQATQRDIASMNNSSSESIARANNANSLELAKVSGNLNKETQLAVRTLDGKIQKDLLNAEYDLKGAESLRTQATTQIQNTMISIESNLKNPDLLELGPDAMAAIINNEIALMKGGVALSYNIAKLDVDGYVASLLDDFESDYSWASGESIDTPVPVPVPPASTTIPATGSYQAALALLNK